VSRIALCFIFALALLASPLAQALPRVLKFEGVPVSMATLIKKKFPYVFEREVTLAEVEQVVQFLMSTGHFATIDVQERDLGTTREQLVLAAQVLRRINQITVTGNHAISEIEIKKILRINEGETFERKELLTSADDLQRTYNKEGFFSPKIDIDFTTPSEQQVNINITVDEGKSCQVLDVSFDTPNKALAVRARHMAASLIHQRLSEERVLALQKNMTDYFAQNRYLETRLSSPAIVFNADKSLAKMTYVIEKPDRYEFLFDGNKYFGFSELIDALELEKYYGITSSPAADLTEKLRNLYLNNGFANVSIEAKEKNYDGLFKKEIEFSISEGARVQIKKIEVSGNLSRSSSYYSQQITDNSSDLVSLGYYSRHDIEAGYKNLLIELQNEGYLKAKVQSIRTEYSKKKNFITVYLSLDEGPLTQIRKIDLEGLSDFSRNQILSVLGLRPNDPLSLKKLEDGLQQIKDFYRSKGYLEMKISNETSGASGSLVVYNDTNTQADIDIQLVEGPKVLVKEISIQGNTQTKRDVILRELQVVPGDVLTPQKLEDSIYRLQKLGLFAKVDITTKEEGSSAANRTLIVTVAERDPGVITSGIGINNRYSVTYRGFLGFAYRNLGGTGRAISSRLDLDYPQNKEFSFLENKISLGYLEPYIFGTKNRGRVNLIRDERVEDPGQVDPTIIVQDNLEANLLLERDLSRHVLLTYNAWDFTNRRRFYRDTGVTRQVENVGKTGPMLEIDYRDNPFDTTKGHYTKLELNYADPTLGSSRNESLLVQFVKFSGGFTYFQRVRPSTPHFLWINSVHAGYLTNLRQNAPNGGVPYSEMYTLGGASTIRGFDTQRDADRIPNIYELAPKRDSTYVIGDFIMTRDTYYFLLKSELRIPVYGAFALALFYDGGAVYIDQPGVVIPDPYRDSWGFGLRVNTPVGPASADVGFKLNRHSYYDPLSQSRQYETPWAFHLSIGNF
jgi:outer membrane protein assembly complex protein YaeT